MIFVTVGSTEFDALVEQVDRLAPRLRRADHQSDRVGSIHRPATAITFGSCLRSTNNSSVRA